MFLFPSLEFYSHLSSGPSKADNVKTTKRQILYTQMSTFNLNFTGTLKQQSPTSILSIHFTFGHAYHSSLLLFLFSVTTFFLHGLFSSASSILLLISFLSSVAVVFIETKSLLHPKCFAKLPEVHFFGSSCHRRRISIISSSVRRFFGRGGESKGAASEDCGVERE